MLGFAGLKNEYGTAFTHDMVTRALNRLGWGGTTGSCV